MKSLVTLIITTALLQCCSSLENMNSTGTCPDEPSGPDPAATEHFSGLDIVWDFLEKYPDADRDGDGRVVPTEVLYYRTVHEGGSPERRDAVNLMRAAYEPGHVDTSRVYGPAEGKKIKLFILSGQSNMVGLGLSSELPPEIVKGCDNILMFEEGKWQPLRPLGYTFGPEISFAYALANAWPDETIGIVKRAIGGTGIMAWIPDWTAENAALTYDADKGSLWAELTGKLKNAMMTADCDPSGFVWQQGAADMRKQETGLLYLENLQALTGGLRKETGVPDLPLVLGSYRSGDVPDDITGYDLSFVNRAPYLFASLVIKAQYDAQDTLAPARMVPLRDLPLHEENIHYDTKGILMLGKMFAEAYLDLVR